MPPGLDEIVQNLRRFGVRIGMNFPTGSQTQWNGMNQPRFTLLCKQMRLCFLNFPFPITMMYVQAYTMLGARCHFRHSIQDPVERIAVPWSQQTNS